MRTAPAPACQGRKGVIHATSAHTHASERTTTISRRFYRQSGPPIKKTRLNHEIRLSPVRLINERNEQVGVIDTRDALRMAQEAGLDLVEIQPDSRPPLCKIMDYGKYKYELSKKNSGQKQKSQEIKEVRLGRSAKIDPHDVKIRVDQARKFIMQGHKVQFIQRFRGREMAFQDIGLARLRDIADGLQDIAKMETPPRSMGRQMSMTLAPDRPRVEALKRKLAAEAAERGEALPDEDDEIEDQVETTDVDADTESEESTTKADEDTSKSKSKKGKPKPEKKDDDEDEYDPTALAETPADLRD